MKLSCKTVVLSAIGIAVLSAVIHFWTPPSRKAKVTGPLTPIDVAEIKRVVLRERAALVSGEFAPQRITNISATEKGMRLTRNLRERAAGELRSIATVDGQYVVVDFGDRWNTNNGYDYELRRTTKGWRVEGAG